MFQQYDLIIFDFDGTIADLGVDWVKLKEELSEQYKAKVEYLDAFLDALPEGQKKEAYTKVMQYELKGVDNMVPIVNTINIIRSLSGKTLAIFTTNTKAAIEKALEMLDMSNVFDIKVFKEDVVRHKPDPEGIELILKKTGFSPEQTIYIGDKQNDVDGGTRAGVRTILVSELQHEKVE